MQPYKRSTMSQSRTILDASVMCAETFTKGI